MILALASSLSLSTWDLSKQIAEGTCALRRHCHVGLFNPITSIPISKLDHFDKRDHDVLVALQVFAKVAEVWFRFIVASLVSLIIFRLAERQKGLSIELSTRPFEFADLLSLFDTPLRKTRKF